MLQSTNIPVPAELLQQLVNYLSDRPFRESAAFIQGILEADKAHKAAQSAPAETAEIKEFPKTAS